jgi:hypothetical protein
MVLNFGLMTVFSMPSPFVWQVSLNVAKISVDATPGLVGDIKQVLIKLLLSPAGYVQPCLTLLASQSLKLFHFLACYPVSICACLIKHTLLCNYAPPT